MNYKYGMDGYQSIVRLHKFYQLNSFMCNFTNIYTVLVFKWSRMATTSPVKTSAVGRQFDYSAINLENNYKWPFPRETHNI